jgi:hypothetical protein
MADKDEAATTDEPVPGAPEAGPYDNLQGHSPDAETEARGETPPAEEQAEAEPEAAEAKPEPAAAKASTKKASP